jgi:hypothetical protein
VLARGVEDWIFSRGSSFVTSQQLPMKDGQHKHKQAAVPSLWFRKGHVEKLKVLVIWLEDGEYRSLKLVSKYES